MIGEHSAWPLGASAAWALFRRELLRFFRQPSRIAASIGTPILIWGFLASGFAGAVIGAPDSSAPADSFVNPASGSDMPYAIYLIPGTATLVAMFAAIFASMSLIEDRRDGSLRAALISPAPRSAIVAAKTAAGALAATMQAGVVLLASPVLGAPASAGALALAVIMLALTAAGLTSFGLALAWKVNSSEGFHGVMNVILMPMWLLSGAMFPVRSSAAWLRPVMLMNPLSWATEAVRGAMHGSAAWAPMLGTAVFAGAMLVFASAGIGRTP